MSEPLAAETMTPLEQVAADAALDSNGRALALVEGGRRWPVLQAPPDSTLGGLLDEVAIVEQLEAGNPGVVIVEDGRPLGIVTRTALLDYMSTRYRVAGTLLGDETLPGVPRMPPLVLECSTCHVRNELREFVEGSTPCVSGHLLTVDWGVTGADQCRECCDAVSRSAFCAKRVAALPGGVGGADRAGSHQGGLV